MNWKPLTGSDTHEVSDDGRVRNAATERLLKLQVSDSGYLKARIFDGRHRAVFVHKAVLLAFVGPAPSPRHEAAHKNGMKLDNRLDNLEWKLKEENEADKRRHGTVPRCFTGHRRVEHVPEVLKLAREGKNSRASARSSDFTGRASVESSEGCVERSGRHEQA